MPFSSEWLALREPADQLARNSELLKKACLAAGPAPVILDLGCGTGSNMRALAPLLPKSTVWHLVDNDAELLEIAASSSTGNIFTHQLDLADVSGLPIDGATLVTGSALLDLVSKSWFTELVRNINAPLYFALSYDGRMSWEPSLSDDESITASFNQHQKSDKGLGVAMGPDSPEVAAQVLQDHGFLVERAKSDWRLRPSDAALQEELLLGIAGAATESGNERAKAWGDERVLLSGESYCTIGHEDVFAIPARVESAR